MVYLYCDLKQVCSENSRYSDKLISFLPLSQLTRIREKTASAGRSAFFYGDSNEDDMTLSCFTVFGEL